MLSFSKVIQLLFVTIPAFLCHLPPPENYPCNYTYAAEQFSQKVLVPPYPLLEYDPYLNATPAFLNEVYISNNNTVQVCAIKYLDPDNITYEMQTFPDNQTAVENGYITTHVGMCGSCSTLQDLSVYMLVNLTKWGTWCGFFGAINNNWEVGCYEILGMTKPCAQMYMLDASNDRQNCLKPCVIDWVLGMPYVNKQFQLNKCLNCDQVDSGSIFQYFAGRTRRDSGLDSEITRNSSEILNVTQCYY